jgi:protein-tyrosine phosphatase
MRVLFICTANVSRSPYAQIRTTEMFGDQLVAMSAGIPGTEGRQMDPDMEAELPFDDEAAISHRSRPVTITLVEMSDLIVTMEFAHHMRLLDRWPETASSVFGLRQIVDALERSGANGSARERILQARSVSQPNSMMWDVADPYRRGRRAARRCADELDDLVLRLGVGLGYEPVAED